MAKSKLRFDLFAVLEGTAGIAVICVLLTGASGRAAWTTDFKSLPQDDSILLSWLEEQNRKDVMVTRANNSITLEMKTGSLTGLFNSFDGLPNPS
jgi:hypothetical protein